MKKNNLFPQPQIEQLEKKLNHRFRDKKLIKEALTHRSWLNEHREEKRPSNERLEFLGDAILEFWATKNLFLSFPRLPEGVLTNIRAALVCTESLAQKAQKINLGHFLLLSRGEEKNGGRENHSILADTFEAVIGAIFMDAGLKKTEDFLREIFGQELKEKGKRGDVKDNKSKFQELAQAKTKITPVYRVIGEKGPDHHKLFRVALYLGKKKIAEGEGWSKQEAEEAAAAKGLTLIKNKVK